MARPKFWHRFFEGLKRTANIIAITVLIVAAILTVDWVPLVAGAVIELVYLVGYILWPSLPKSFHEKVASLSGSDGSSAESLNRGSVLRLTRYLLAAPTRRSVTFLDGVLIVVTVIGFVVILFFGFGKHLLSHPWPYLTHAQGWDAGAIIWTGFFLLYYTWKFPFTNVRLVDKAIISIIAWGSLPLLYLAGVSMNTPTRHVFYVWLIGVCFFIIDFLIWKRHPQQQEQDLSRTSLLWADIPIVVAFLVLFGYLWYHPDTEHPDVFVSGVVSCQLLISNAVFVVMEFGLLQPGKTVSSDGKHAEPMKSNQLLLEVGTGMAQTNMPSDGASTVRRADRN